MRAVKEKQTTAAIKDGEDVELSVHKGMTEGGVHSPRDTRDSILGEDELLSYARAHPDRVAEMLLLAGLAAQRYLRKCEDKKPPPRSANILIGKN